VFGAELRRRWRSWLILAALVALVGGLVLAAAAAGRRTATAFPRFVSAYGYDVAAFNPQSGRALLRFPEIASATQFDSPLTGQPTCSCGRRIPAQYFGVVEMSSAAMHQTSKLQNGRWPDQSRSDEVLASFPLAQNIGVRVGTVIRVPFYAASQADVVDAGGALPDPTGPTVSLRVVGIEAAEVDLPAGSTPSYGLYGTRALAAQLQSATSANSVYLVRLRHGAADLPRFNSEVQPLVAGTSNLDAVAESVQASIHPQAVGWWVLAALLALAGIAVVGQAIARQSLVESGDYGTLMAIGLPPRQLIAIITVRNLAVALGGVVGAIALAVALSPLTPLGEARVVEPSTGFAFDPVVLLAGALSLVVVVLLLGLWPAVRISRLRFVEDRNTFARPFTIASRLSALGAPPSAVIGARRAFERGHGPSAVPVVSAFLGTTLAVLALSATAVFGASLGHLLSTPGLYGDAFQVMFSPNSSQPLPSDLVSDLRADPAISRITEGVGTEITINGVSVAAVALHAIRGPLLLSTVTGSAPIANGEVGLGASTMRRVGARVGSVIPVTVELPSGGTRTTHFRVVSQVSFPADFGNGGLGTGAVFSMSGYLDAACPPGPAQATCRDAVNQSQPPTVLARAASGPGGQAAIARYGRAHSSVAQFPVVPTSLVNFGQAVNFPLILGLALAVFGAATLLHLLVVSVVRRRRETGLLRAIGFVRSQVVSAVCWQATTVALVGIAVGVPLGVGVGRAIWRAFATDLGVVPVTTVTLWWLTALGFGVLVMANLLALSPAWAAAGRQTPGALLRTQ
jgi:hypothetical protein